MIYHELMRTTLDVDEDLLLAARDLAQQRRVSMGRVVSELLRKALKPGDSHRIRNGVPLFTPQRGVAKPSLSFVNRLRDE